MNTALAERDDVTVEGEIIEHRAPLTLFGTDDPAAVVERATRVATVLADVIAQRHLSARIGNRDHIMLEGWTLLGSMLGVFGEVEWTRPIADGWEARAVARTMAGSTVGAAEAMCTRAERTWKQRDEYAIRSMAQTRALSKALRLPLGFIVELAGFAATPAEEMDATDQPERRGPAPKAASTPSGAPAPRTPEEDALVSELFALPGMSTARASLLADAVGVEKGTRANAEQLRAMLARATQSGESAPSPADSDADPGASIPPGAATAAAPAPLGAAAGTLSMDDVLAVSGGEEIPPRPRTDAYRALPSGAERAAARAYWDARPEQEQETLAMALGGPES